MRVLLEVIDEQDTYYLIEDQNVFKLHKKSQLPDGWTRKIDYGEFLNKKSEFFPNSMPEFVQVQFERVIKLRSFI